MTHLDKKNMILDVIYELDGRLCMLQCIYYDGILSYGERQEEIKNCQSLRINAIENLLELLSKERRVA